MIESPEEICKQKAEMVDDMADLFGCKWFEVYSKAALAMDAQQAAIALIKCKGCYHAEQNTNKLADALGIQLPYCFPEVQPEPFGYFKAEPFGWTDCSEDDEGAIALYEKI